MDDTLNLNNLISLLLLLNAQTLSTTTIKQATQQIFGTSSPMVRIIECESGFRQYDETGDVLTSSTSDKGIAQINAPTWRNIALQQGIDIDKPLGNLLWAKTLYDAFGTKPWACSRIVKLADAS